MNTFRLPVCMVVIATFFHALAAGAQSKAKWIWDAKGERPNDPLYFSKTVALGEAPKAAKVTFTCDNSCKVYLNGKLAYSSNNWN